MSDNAFERERDARKAAEADANEVRKRLVMAVRDLRAEMIRAEKAEDGTAFRNAFFDGQSAQDKGRGRESNPYDVESCFHEAWDLGHHYAEVCQMRGDFLQRAEVAEARNGELVARLVALKAGEPDPAPDESEPVTDPSDLAAAGRPPACAKCRATLVVVRRGTKIMWRCDACAAARLAADPNADGTTADGADLARSAYAAAASSYLAAAKLAGARAAGAFGAKRTAPWTRKSVSFVIDGNLIAESDYIRRHLIPALNEILSKDDVRFTKTAPPPLDRCADCPPPRGLAEYSPGGAPVRLCLDCAKRRRARGELGKRPSLARRAARAAFGGLPILALAGAVIFAAGGAALAVTAWMGIWPWW